MQSVALFCALIFKKKMTIAIFCAYIFEKRVDKHNYMAYYKNVKGETKMFRILNSNNSNNSNTRNQWVSF